MNAAALAAALSGDGRRQQQRDANAEGARAQPGRDPETIIPLLRQPGMLDKLAQYLPVRLCGLLWISTAQDILDGST